MLSSEISYYDQFYTDGRKTNAILTTTSLVCCYRLDKGAKKLHDDVQLHGGEFDVKIKL